ncbi:MAG: DUF1476 domain-containing protein [Alphaproteobacteria bacterium]
MTTFDDREKSFEAKYHHDEELNFKIGVRRNKLLGLWVAEKLGIVGADAEAYAKEVVQSDFEKVGDDDVVEKVLGDFNARHVEITEHAIRHEMERLITVAKAEVMKE